MSANAPSLATLYRAPRQAVGELRAIEGGPALLCAAIVAAVGAVVLIAPMARVITWAFGPAALPTWRWALSDAGVREAAKVGLALWATTVPFQMVLGVAAALGVHALIRDGRMGWALLLGLAFFAPYAVPSSAVRVIWDLMFQENGTVAKALARWMGVPATAWYGSELFATLCLASIWQFTPFVFVMTLPALLAVPAGHLRSAAADGADGASRMAYLLLPSVRQALWRVFLLRTALMLTKFDLPYLFSGTGSNERGLTLAVRLLREKTTVQSLPVRGCVVAVLLGLGVLVILLALWGLRFLMAQAGEALRQPLADLCRREVWLRRRLGGWWRAAVWATMALTALTWLAPFGILAVASFVPEAWLSHGLDMTQIRGLTWRHHLELLGAEGRPFVAFGRNTLVVSGVTVVAVCLVSLIAAYVATRRRTALTRYISAAVVLGYLMPPVALTIGYGYWAARCHLHDSLWLLAVANVGLCLPFGIWLMTGFLDQVPIAYDLAAAADGAPWHRRLIHIICPLSRPGLYAVALSTFVLTWNDIAFASVLISGPRKPLAAGMAEMLQLDGVTQVGQYATASLYAASAALLLCATLYLAYLKGTLSTSRWAVERGRSA